MAKQDYFVGDKVRVLTTSGQYDGSVVLVGDMTRGDNVVVVETPDKIRIPVTSRQFLQLVQRGSNPVESTTSDTVEENDSADNLNEVEENTMATKKAATSTKPSKETKDKIAKEVTKKIGKKTDKPSGVDFNKSMQQLSRESGVSVITLRKYMQKRPDEISHHKAENGTFKFNEASVKDVIKIKEANLKVYNP